MDIIYYIVFMLGMLLIVWIINQIRCGIINIRIKISVYLKKHAIGLKKQELRKFYNTPMNKTVGVTDMDELCRIYNSTPLPGCEIPGCEFNEEKFYDCMELYFDENIVREVLSNDTYGVFCLGELYYIASPFALYDGVPIMMRASKRSIIDFIQDDHLIFDSLRLRIEKNSSTLLNTFPEDKLEYYKEFIQNNKPTDKKLSFRERMAMMKYDDHNSIMPKRINYKLENRWKKANCKLNLL